LPFIARTTKARSWLLNFQDENKLEYPKFDCTPQVVCTLKLKASICKVYIDYFEQGILPSDINLSKRVILSSPYYLLQEGILYKIPVSTKWS
jgi:hypothetical protein